MIPGAILLTAAVSYVLFRTKAGLVIRAVGDSHVSAHSLGYNVIAVRYLCVMFGGACAGLAGGYLSLAYTPQWVENMTAGRGWIALALVVFASWLPWRAVIGAYLFGAISILSYTVQTSGARYSLAIPVEPALSRHRDCTGGDIGKPGHDARQYAGLSRQAIRA